MNARARLTPDETRERILVVAEELFRRIGYSKTAVADIAAELGMSPANVYRFFPSKSAIVEAICQQMLSAAHVLMASIAAEDRPATDRLEAISLALHAFNKANYVSERRMHEMVEVAITENWNAVEAHFAAVVGIYAGVIADGIRRGEFPEQDVAMAALTFKQITASVMHPVMLASCSHYDLENQTIRIVRFGVAALKSGVQLPRPAVMPFSVPLPNA